MTQATPQDLEAPAKTGSGLRHYSPERPVVLLCDYGPHFEGGGANNLRSLLDDETRRSVVWATLAPETGQPADAPGHRSLYLRGGPGAPPRTDRSLFRDTAFGSKALTAELLAECRRLNARAVWVIMHGAAVPMAARLVASGELPVHLSVHDDPAFGVALRSRRYLPLLPLIERSFAKAMRGARSVDVVSKGMVERYRKRYGVETTICNRGVEPLGPVAAPYDRNQGVLRVGVMGGTYGYDALLAMGRAAVGAAKRLGVKPELVVLGQGSGDRLRADLQGAATVEAPGHVEEADGVERLKSCFLLYATYPFDRRSAVFRQTSLMVKICSYLRVGRPFWLHVPADSSLYELKDEGKFVTTWTDMDESHGVASILRAWNDPPDGPEIDAAVERTRLRFFDRDGHRETLFGLLDGLVPPLGGATP